MGKTPKTRSGRPGVPLWPGFQRSPVAMPASKFPGYPSDVTTAYSTPILPHGDGNARVLLVGPPGRIPLPKFLKYLPRFSMLGGFPTEFTSISAAMEAIPLMNAKDNWIDRWIILVTPGWYVEEVRMKPFVSIVGLAADSVFISAPFDEQRPSLKRMDGVTDARATVYMNHYTSIRNVNIAKMAYSERMDYAIWNKDTYGIGKRDDPNKEDVSDFSAFDVYLYPFPNKDDWKLAHGRQENVEHVMSKSILMEGKFSSVFMVNVGSSYNWRNSFDVEINGEGHNADCHFVDCFFDSLFLDRGNKLNEGGCMKVSNCFEVHVRNSLLRVGAHHLDKPKKGEGKFKGAALRVMKNANVCVEGSSLMSAGMDSDRVLHVDEESVFIDDDELVRAGCLFAHSSTDSVFEKGRQWVLVKQGLPPPPDE
jgi:hypothetical protein